MSKPKDKAKKHDPNAPKEAQRSRFFPDLRFTPVHPDGDTTLDPIGFRPDGLAPKEFLYTRVFIPAGSARESTYLEGIEPNGYTIRETARRFVDCCTQRAPDDAQFPCKPNETFARIWLDALVDAVEISASNAVPQNRSEATVKAVRRTIPQGKTERFL